MNSSTASAIPSHVVAMLSRSSIGIFPEKPVQSGTKDPVQKTFVPHAEDPAKCAAHPPAAPPGIHEHGEDAGRLLGAADLRAHLAAVEDELRKKIARDLLRQSLLEARL